MEDGLATLIQSGLTLIGVVVILIVLDPHLALLTFLVLPVLAAGALAFRIASADAYRQATAAMPDDDEGKMIELVSRPK